MLINPASRTKSSTVLPLWMEGMVTLFDICGPRIRLNCPQLSYPSWCRSVRRSTDRQTDSLITRLTGIRKSALCSRMFCCPTRKWVSVVKRRPIAAAAVVGFFVYLCVYLINAEENYDKIGIQLLEEKEKIMQSVNKELENTEPLTERQIFEMDQSERRSRIHTVCQSHGNKSLGLIGNLIGGSSYNLTYCVIPRSDHTFWLQIFRYINHDYMEFKPQSPFDLDVDQVHTRPYGKTRVHTWRMLTKEQKHQLLKTKVFLSVQDPYMRLWSTYMRAIVLPELWGTVGLRIDSRRPRGVRGKTPACGHDVTFAEFLTYVLDSYEKDFATYVGLCDPCQLDPYYVVKAETTHRDNAFILEHLKMDWSVRIVDYFKDAAVVKMINSTVRNSYKYFHEAERKGCKVTLHVLNLRLWRMFMMEAVLPEGLATPPMEDMDQLKLVQMVIDHYRHAHATGVDMTSQKRKYMVAAYRNLHPALLKSVEERHKLDFKLYAYDSHPHDIYGGV